MIVKHKFENQQVNLNAEILILGTFNPDKKDNEAEYYYARSRNFLWTILAACYNYEDLKPKDVLVKKHFAIEKKIAFMDLIKSANYENVYVDYDDEKLDLFASEWNNILDLINEMPHLKKIAFTRKTFKNIPNIKNKIEELESCCKEKNIQFNCLITPARFVNQSKIEEWKKFIIG